MANTQNESTIDTITQKSIDDDRPEAIYEDRIRDVIRIAASNSFLDRGALRDSIYQAIKDDIILETGISNQSVAGDYSRYAEEFRKDLITRNGDAPFYLNKGTTQSETPLSKQPRAYTAHAPRGVMNEDGTITAVYND